MLVWLDGFSVELKTVLRQTKDKFILLVCGVIKLVVLPFLLFLPVPSQSPCIVSGSSAC